TTACESAAQLDSRHFRQTDVNEEASRLVGFGVGKHGLGRAICLDSKAVSAKQTFEGFQNGWIVIHYRYRPVRRARWRGVKGRSDAAGGERGARAGAGTLGGDPAALSGRCTFPLLCKEVGHAVSELAFFREGQPGLLAPLIVLTSFRLPRD